MNREPLVTGQNVSCHTGQFKCLSWSAIIAGAFVAIGLGFLLNLFGIAIGLTAYTTTPEGVTTLAVGGYIGMAIGVLVVMFVAGWVSGFLGYCAGCVHCNIGALYGFVTWSLALILTILLTSSVGQFTAIQYEALTNPNSSAMRMSSMPSMNVNSNAQSVASNAQMASSSNAMASNNKGNSSNTAQTNDEKAAKTLGKSLLLVFLLFFVGAIICCYGGYVGMDAGIRKRNRLGNKVE